MQYIINPSLKQLNNHWVFLYEFLSWRYRLLVFPLLIQGTWSSIGLWVCGCVLRGADGSVSSGVSLSILCSGPFPIRKPCLGGGQAAGLQVTETGKLACRKAPAPGIWPLSTFGGNTASEGRMSGVLQMGSQGLFYCSSVFSWYTIADFNLAVLMGSFLNLDSSNTPP